MLDFSLGRHQLTFDVDAYDFQDLMLSRFSNLSVELGGERVDDLTKIHTAANIGKNVEQYRQAAFQCFRTDEFQKLYKKFGAYLIDTYFCGVGLIQKTPTVRIQLPDASSTSYHCDGWYGHGSSVRSFWMPLVDVDEGNTLYIATDVHQSRCCLEEILAQTASLLEINEIASKACKPFKGSFGDLLVFSSEMIHGANQNVLGYSRVSFDFRIAPDPNDLGSKPRSNFYSRDELNADIRQIKDDRAGGLRGISYSNHCSGISAKAQLMLCTAYADANGINIIGNESEIVTLPYMPVLKHYLSPELGVGNCVIVFGIEIFEGNKKLALDVIEEALRANKTIVFCAQGVVLGPDNPDTCSVLDLIGR